ncbi:MAG: AMP-binding protein [Spirochaetota bacterium]
MQHFPTVYAAFRATAEKYPGNICLQTPQGPLTYHELAQRVDRLAAFLQHNLHLRKGAAVIVLADNHPLWLLTALAVQAVGAVEFPLSPGAGNREIKHLLKVTRCRHFVTADAAVTRHIRFMLAGSHCIQLSGAIPQQQKKIVSLEAILAETRVVGFHHEGSAVSAVIRTSGTTGTPKQVPVLHASFLHSMRVIPRVLHMGPKDVVLSCLPSWHLYARLVEYTALACGAQIVYTPISGLQRALKTSGCTIFPSFPEIWEKIHHEVLVQLGQGFIGKLVRRLISLSVHTNRILERTSSRSRYAEATRSIFSWLRLSYLLPVRIVLMPTLFAAIRRRVSPTLRYAIMGDAPLPLAVDETLRALGFEVLEGYGSTEQCVTALRRPGRHFPGVIGRVLPGVEVAIHHTLSTEWNGIALGEIAVSGDNVFPGYFTSVTELAAVTAGTPTYLTGDIGYVDRSRNLVVVGRKANVLRLRTGELVFPELVENVLRGSRFVGRVVVLGGGSDALMALVVPDFAALLAWLEPHGGHDPGLAAEPESDRKFWQHVTQSSAVKGLYSREFARLLGDSGLPAYAWPVGFSLVPHLFHRGRELTPTLKVRRSQVARLYQKEIRLWRNPEKMDASLRLMSLSHRSG